MMHDRLIGAAHISSGELHPGTEFPLVVDAQHEILVNFYDYIVILTEQLCAAVRGRRSECQGSSSEGFSDR